MGGQAALVATRSASVEAAIQWLYDHQVRRLYARQRHPRLCPTETACLWAVYQTRARLCPTSTYPPSLCLSPLVRDRYPSVLAPAVPGLCRHGCPGLSVCPGLSGPVGQTGQTGTRQTALPSKRLEESSLL